MSTGNCCARRGELKTLGLELMATTKENVTRHCATQYCRTFHRTIVLLLFFSLLLGLMPNAAVFGQDYDKTAVVPNWSKTSHSVVTDPVDAGRFGELADQADLVALGRVRRARSFWRDGAVTIETETVIALNHLVKGRAPAEIVVRTDGGFIERDGIGMIAPHEASFAIGEPVLIFAQKQGDIYRIGDGAAGKFTVEDDLVFGALSAADDARIDEFVAVLVAKTAASSAPATARRWRTPDTEVAFKININTAQAGTGGNTTDAFVNAIRAAATTWNRTPGADFELVYAGATPSTQTGYNHVSEIVFMPQGIGNRGALAQVWYTKDLTIVEADIWINDDYVWDVSGDPANDALDLQSVLVHEFGHWLILDHIDDPSSVMYPTLAPGATRRRLHQRDMAGISAIYPCADAACSSGH